jgi:PelA/Pel-15E family pectate lyase
MQRVKVTGIRLDRVKDQSLPKGFDLVVVPDATAPPLLARFYDIETNQPMFVGRDGIVRKTLAEIEYERRVGYAWYIRFPEDMIEKEYPAWKEKWRDSQKTVR